MKITVKLLILLSLQLNFSACSSDTNEDDNQMEVVENIYDLGDVFFTTQSELDDFGNENYTQINGTLLIADNEQDPIINLAPLKSLRRLNGDFLILRNPDITSLKGIENITSLSGSLILTGLTSLTSLEFAPDIDQMGIELYKLPLITAFPNFNNLQTAKNIVIQDLPNIQTIDAFHNIERIENGRINITGNTQLTTINGFENISQSDLPLSIAFIGNDNLANISEFSKYRGGRTHSLDFSNNAFKDLDFLQNIVALESLTIRYGENDSFSQFNFVSSIPSLNFIAFSALPFENLNDFKSLTSISSIFITNCHSLTSLDGLNNLNKLADGDFNSGQFSNNSSLRNFCAISNWVENVSESESFDIITEDNLYNPSLNDILEGNCVN